MQPFAKSLATWTDRLACALISSLTSDMLVEVAKATEMQVEALSYNQLADSLYRHSRYCGELQSAILDAWRKSHSDVVAAAELISIDGSPEQCAALLRQFGAETILLELITDERDDGWELAASVVNNVKHPIVRRELASILDQWSTEDAATLKAMESTAQQLRVVIFGGHVHDESKMTERLFEGSAFDVRWKPFEKGVAVPLKTLNNAVANTDAILLITTMVSHNIMQIVKRLARKKKIPFRAIPKATDMHLIAALGELFPNSIVS